MKLRRSHERHPCPIEDCTYNSLTFLDLMTHMVESERHRTLSAHQDWLIGALGIEFAKYAFKNDRRVADIFSNYFQDTGNELPIDPTEFYSWFQDKSHGYQQHR